MHRANLLHDGLNEWDKQKGCALAAEPDGKECFGRYLRQTKLGLLRIDAAAIQREKRFDGKWGITTNDDTLTSEDLALGYKQLMRVEECWRSIKLGLRMRPVYHWAPHRIEAHIKLCVLAPASA